MGKPCSLPPDSHPGAERRDHAGNIAKASTHTNFTRCASVTGPNEADLRSNMALARAKESVPTNGPIAAKTRSVFAKCCVATSVSARGVSTYSPYF